MKTIIKNILLLALTGILISSCSSDDDSSSDTPVVKDDPYTLLTRVQTGSSVNYNFYLQSISDLDKELSFTNEKAVEAMAGGAAGVYLFDNKLYINEYATSKSITKWSKNDKGVYVSDGAISTKEIGFAGNPYFLNKNTAFVGGSSASKILIFNPSTMTKTGVIDFSNHSRLNELTDFPSAGGKVNIETVTEMVVRDNHLFVGVFLLNEMQAFTPASLSSDILVIDLNKVDVAGTDNSAAVVKWISDDRGVGVGSWNSGSGSSFMTVDEKGDIYLLAHNMWGGARASGVSSKPACVLRIKKGSLDFDKEYYFDVEAVSKGDGNSVVNMEYAGNGIFFATSNDNSAINPDDPYSFYLDPIAQWYQFNLYDKTAKQVNDTYTKGAWASKILFDQNKAYIPYQNKTESYFLEVDMTSMKSNKKFSTVGAPILFKSN